MEGLYMSITHPKIIDINLDNIKNRYFWVEPFITKTLEMIDNNHNINLETTPYFKLSRTQAKRDIWWYNCKTDNDIKNRINDLYNLYTNLKTKGYDNNKPITVEIDFTGEIYPRDGFHRLSILRFINYGQSIPAIVSKRSSYWTDLKERVAIFNNGQNLYQPPLHPDFNDWHIWRKDTPDRYNIILRELDKPPKTILDIGANEGYFSFNLVKEGYDVIALEYQNERAFLISQLSRALGLPLKIEITDWQDYKPKDNIGYMIHLSTFHHSFLHNEDKAIKSLDYLSSKIPVLFFSMATSQESKMKDSSFHITRNNIITMITTSTNYNKCNVLDRRFRPIFKFWW